MPDLRAHPVDCEVPSVCTTTNGMCHSLGITVPEGVGFDVMQACAWVAQRLQLGAGNGFAAIPGESFIDNVELGLTDGGWRWDAGVWSCFRGTPVPQLQGTIKARNDGLRWDVPAVSFTSTGAGLGVVHDAASAKAAYRADTGCEYPAEFAEPMLVYARPSDPTLRRRMQWPDESEGPIYRPSWCLHPLIQIFVDAATGVVWRQELS